MMLLGLATPLPAFDAPAAPASRLLPELGKAFGVRMEAAPSIAREVLLVRVKDAPLAETMKRIAKAVGGEWESKDGVYRLSLSGAVEAKERRAEALAVGEATLADARRRRDARRTDGESRSGGALDAAFAALPPEDVGGLGYLERVVYSTRPTRTQRPMPLAVQRALDFSRLPKINRLRLGEMPPPVPGPPVVALLALRRDPNGSAVQAALFGSDAAGTVVGGEVGEYNSYPPIPPEEAKRPVPPRPDAIVELPKDRRPLADALVSALPGFRTDVPYDDDQSPLAQLTYSDDDLTGAAVAAPEVLRPEAQDPLALVAGPLLAALADGQATNLVADIPDSAFYGTLSLARAPKAGEFVRGAFRVLDLDVVVADGWTVVRPIRPALARASRLDRAALGAALRSLAKDRALSLGAQAAYAAAQPLAPSAPTFEAPYFNVVDRGYGKRIAASYPSGERRLLRVYRALGGGGKQEPRPFRRLPASAQKALADLVYNAVGGITATFPFTAAGDTVPVSYSGYAGGLPQSLRQERTVAWGDGIPPGAVLAVREESVPTYFGLAPSGARPRMDERASNASTLFATGRGSLATSNNPRLERYQKGSVTRLTFTLSDASGNSFERSLESEALDASASPVAFGALPLPLRRRIERGEEEARRVRGEGPGGPGQP